MKIGYSECHHLCFISRTRALSESMWKKGTQLRKHAILIYYILTELMCKYFCFSFRHYNNMYITSHLQLPNVIRWIVSKYTLMYDPSSLIAVTVDRSNGRNRTKYSAADEQLSTDHQGCTQYNMPMVSTKLNDIQLIVFQPSTDLNMTIFKQLIPVQTEEMQRIFSLDHSPR